MDTNRLKKFATEARNILKAGIAAKLMIRQASTVRARSARQSETATLARRHALEQADLSKAFTTNGCVSMSKCRQGRE